MKNKFPVKNTKDVLEDEIDYCQKLIDVIEKEDTLSQYPKVREQLNLLKETLADDVEHLQISEDKDAKVGHKTADSSFFGYKTLIAISEERIITAATVTKSSGLLGMEFTRCHGNIYSKSKKNIETN